MKKLRNTLKYILIISIISSCATSTWVNSTKATYKSPVLYESSNFVGTSMILAKVESDELNTRLYLKLTNDKKLQFASSTFLYNRQNVNESFRLKNIQEGKYLLDKYYNYKRNETLILTFERVSSGISEINLKEVSNIPNLEGYEITGIRIENPVRVQSDNSIFSGTDKIKNETNLKGNCLVCGNKGNIFCKICSGKGTVQKSRQVRTPVKKSRYVTKYKNDYKGNRVSYSELEYYTDYENKTEYYDERCYNCGGTGKVKCTNIVAHPVKITD